MNKTITVPEFLSDKKEELFDIVDDTIAKSSKLHISAPVGTGKTTFAIDVVEHIGKEYKTIFLFPIIAISEQAQFEFGKRGINAKIFNSKLNKDDVKDCQVILSTIDSAFKLIDDDFLKNDKVLFILDESHTYLQNARENFSRSVEAILNSGYPIIGLSATPSVWVNNYLFEIEEYIEISVTDHSPKQINPIEVQKGLLRFVAEEVGKKNNDKWIIFLERRKDQKTLKRIIKKLRPKSKVCILNADTKNGKEKKTWKYLMRNGKLSAKVDIAIINSVAQAGINIKNTDINHVILVGKHDPYGVAQFIGRCRKYKGKYDFYFGPGGRFIKEDLSAKYINDRIKLINAILHYKTQNYHKDLADLLGLLGSVAIDTNGSLIANKCIIATKIYSVLRETSGKLVADGIAQMYPNDIIVNPIKQEAGITGSTSTQKKAKLEKYRKDLVKEISNQTSLILSISRYVDDKTSFEEALEMLKYTTSNLFQAIVENKPNFPKKKDRKKLKKIIKLAEKADRSVNRVVIAATLFRQSRHKKSVLNKYIRTSNSSINSISKAKLLFEVDVKGNYIITDVIEQLEDMIGQVKNTDDWKDNLKTMLGKSLQPEKLADAIFSSCLQLKNKEVIINAERKIHRELIGINKTFADYIKHKGLLEDYI